MHQNKLYIEFFDVDETMSTNFDIKEIKITTIWHTWVEHENKVKNYVRSIQKINLCIKLTDRKRWRGAK